MQALYKAEYDYAAQTDDELAIAEDQLLFLLEDSSDGWVKVRIKTDNPGAEAPREGLVPANYVVPATALASVTAAYDYDADPNEPEELTMRENEQLQLYEKGQDWSLVGRPDAVGFVPTAYLDDSAAVPAQNNELPQEGEVTTATPPAAASPAEQPAFLLPPTRSAAAASASAVETFNASLITSSGLMKSKKKGTLGIGNGALFFASESDKTPVQQVSLDALTSFDKPDKHKVNVFFDGGVEFHFELKAKDEATKVHDILQAATGQSNGHAEGQEEDQEAQEDGGYRASAAYSSPARSALPPPPRALRMANSSDEEEEDEDDAPARAPPPPAAPPAPPAPPAPSAPVAPSSSASASQGKHGTMAYDFEATEPDEITVAEGDDVVILDDSSEDWWMVRRVASGQEGNVPAQYVEVSEGAPSAPQAPAAPPAPAPPMGILPPPQRSRALSTATTSTTRQADEPEDEEEAERQRQIEADAQKAQRLHDQEQRRIMKEAEARDMRAARGIHFADEQPSRMPAPRPIPVPADPSDLNHPPPPPPPPTDADRRTPSVPEVSKTERKKPNMAKTRVWKDLTGNFKVEAEFLGVSNGKVRLHKVNGVVIDVPLQKMSHEDVKLIKILSRRDTAEDDMPLAATSSSRDKDRERKEQERERRHRAHLAAHHQKKKPTVDWFEFFLNAGCDLDDCTRYAHNFERDRIDEEVLPELEAPTLRNLGLREGDLIRVRKHIKSKYGRSAALPADEASAKDKVQDGDKEGPGLFTGPSGGLKSTRRGRPTPSSRANTTDTVSSDGLKGASEELARAGSPTAARDVASPSPSKSSRRSSSVQPIVGSISGFDDDAWTVKAPSKPNTPSPAPPTTSSPEPKPASPPPQKSANDTLADDILKRMGISENQQRPTSAAPTQRQTSNNTNFVSPSPTPQQPDPNAPRGPFAPVAQNAPMLNPLIPTQTGFSGFVPTRPQSTGMMPQSTGMPMSMGPQPTGMMAQPTGMPMSMGMSMPMSSQMGMSMAPQQTGYMQSQPTSAPYQNPQMTSYSQYQPQSQYQPSPQLSVQSTGYGLPQQQPQQQQAMSPGGLAPQPTGVFANPSMFQQPQPTGSTPASKYEPGNVFAAMKTGVNSLDSTPKTSDSYDALRPQMTGMPAQPLQPQPTGFAPMQMFAPQQQPQMPMQTGMYRQY